MIGNVKGYAKMGISTQALPLTDGATIVQTVKGFILLTKGQFRVIRRDNVGDVECFMGSDNDYHVRIGGTFDYIPAHLGELQCIANFLGVQVMD